jgi:hypothetical protein
MDFGSASTHDALIDVLRRVKDARNVSDAELEHITGLQSGYLSKILGPSRLKGLTRMTIDVLLEALAIKLVVVPCPEREERMRHRWTQRKLDRVHNASRLAQITIKRALPAAMSEFSRRGNKARWATYTAEERVQMMTELARRRWAKKRRLAPAEAA